MPKKNYRKKEKNYTSQKSPPHLVVPLLLKLLFELLDLLLEVLEFLGELVGDGVALHTLFGT